MFILVVLPLLFLVASTLFTSIRGGLSFHKEASGDINRRPVFVLLVVSRVISIILMAILLYLLLLSGVVVVPHLAIGFIFHYVAIYLIYSEFVSVIFRSLSLWHASHRAKKSLGKLHD